MTIDTQDPEFEAVLQNPKFKLLSRPQQIQFVNEFKQQKRMKVPSSEGFLKNALDVSGTVGRDLNIFATKGFDTATFGALSSLGKLNKDPLSSPFLPQAAKDVIASPEYKTYGEPTTNPGKGISGFINMMLNPKKYHENIAEGFGNTAGFVAGGPGKIFQGLEKAGSKLIPNYLGKTLGRAAGGAASGFSAPGNFEERGGAAKLGLVLGPVLGSIFDVGGAGIKAGKGFMGKVQGKSIPEIQGKISAKEEDIKLGEEELNDLVNLGPGKMKTTAKQIHQGFQNEFGTRLENLKWNLNGKYFQEAFQQTGRDLGAWQNPGSPGARMMDMADSFGKQGNKSFSPKEAQQMVKNLTSRMDLDSTIKFYRNFTEVLSRDYPEFAQLKSDYAPIYDILNASKIPNKGIFSQVASDKIGAEGLARAAEAEQTVGMEPSLLGQTSKQGARVRGQKSELKMFQQTLQDLIKEQTGAKKTLGKVTEYGVKGAAGLVGLKWLEKLLEKK